MLGGFYANRFLHLFVRGPGVTEKAEGLGKLAQDIDHFLFRFAFHDARRVAALQEEAITHWVPTCKSLKGHADKLVDIELARAFVALEQAMLALSLIHI